MKIDIFLFDVTAQSGTENAALNLALHLSMENEVSIHSFTMSKKNYEIDKKYENIKFLCINIDWKKRTYIDRFFSIIKFIIYLKKLNKHSVVIGTTHYINIISSLVLKNRVVACEHLYAKAAPFFSRVARAIAYKLSGYVVVLTQQDYDYYASIGIRNVEMIPNSIVSIANNAEIEHVYENIPRYLTVGRLEHQKGIDSLIKSIFVAKSMGALFAVDVYGEGSQRKYLEKMISDYEVGDYIKLKGWEKRIDLYKGYDLFLLSSRYEGLPLVLLEAMSSGVPCLSFDCPTGPRELIVNGLNGFLVENQNYILFGAMLALWAKSKSLNMSFSENSVLLSRAYSPKIINFLWDNIIKSDILIANHYK